MQSDSARSTANPRHVAVIMDGNGRWAKQRGKERVYGHVHGVETVRRIVEAAREMEIPYLTLYTFSTENWQRPKEEVDALMNLLADTIQKEEANLIENGIKVQIIGDKEGLPPRVTEIFDRVARRTGQNHAMTLSLALNYGGKAEILQAVRNLIEDYRRNPDLPPVTEQIFTRYLQSGDLPDVDLLIRTGGEQRISNFLLWKIAYAELYFTPVLWPDFTKADFEAAVRDYLKRERRYGKTSEQIGKHIS
ncbi:MAG: isoprenyl transferase [Chlorobi bacterium]|nr:isoprenyl transferase [Chlorobiota bacterium]